MPPEAWISFAGLSLLLGLFALWQSLRASFGLAEQDETALTVDGSEARTMLLHEKEAVLENIRDLEFEHEAGKISERDYEAQNAALRERAKEILKLLDEDVAPYRKEADALLARRLSEVAKPPYRDRGASKTSGSDVDESGAGESDEPDADQLCGSCSTRNDADADFCKKCGKSLTADPDGASEEADA